MNDIKANPTSRLRYLVTKFGTNEKRNPHCSRLRCHAHLRHNCALCLCLARAVAVGDTKLGFETKPYFLVINAKPNEKSA